MWPIVAHAWSLRARFTCLIKCMLLWRKLEEWLNGRGRIRLSKEALHRRILWLLLLRFFVEVSKLIDDWVTVDLLMVCACTCPCLRDSTDKVELWGCTCYPLSLSNAIIYCDFRAVLFRGRGIKSSLRISRIEHRTRIYKALLPNQRCWIETSLYGQLIYYRPCHRGRISHCFDLVVFMVLTARWTVMWITFFDNGAIHLFLQLVIGNCFSRLNAIFVEKKVWWKDFIIWN